MCTASPPTKGPLADERGAMLVLGCFAAPFLVGAVYYFVGCTNVIMEREGLQQAADASAFAATVASARAMNAIAVMNVLMTCIMSVLVPMRAMLAAYAKVAATFCGTSTCACAEVADAMRAEAELRVRAEAAEQQGKQLLRALSAAQDALARQVPTLAVRAAAESARRTPAFLDGAPPNVSSSSLAPSGCRKGLPVEDDTFETVCKRTKPFIGELALRIAGPTMLDTLGACRSGMSALALAQIDLEHPEGETTCTEAAEPPCSGSGPHPKKIVDGGQNGSDHLQYWVSVHGKVTDGSAGVIAVGAKNKRSRPATVKSLDIGFSQAEIFFDCSGSWSSGGCNKDEGAMYNTRWSARLRRVHAPSLSFRGDDEVKSTLASPSHWKDLRSRLASVRHDWVTMKTPDTEAAKLLLDSDEGPLQ